MLHIWDSMDLELIPQDNLTQQNDVHEKIKAKLTVINWRATLSHDYINHEVKKMMTYPSPDNILKLRAFLDIVIDVLKKVLSLKGLKNGD